MCLFVIDGTWSRDFNSRSYGLDSAGNVVGNLDEIRRSNSRRFFDESTYPSSKKFYYGGPSFGITGADSKYIYMQVISDIERQIVSGNCTELSLVGWSRGAAIASEIAQGLMVKEFARIYRRVSAQTRRGLRTKNVVYAKAKMIPNIKFLGLFDSVAMIPSFFSRSQQDKEWGEEIPDRVDYFVHVVAGDRTGPIPGVVDFFPRNPTIKSKTSITIPIACGNHADIGGFSDSLHAKFAYQLMKSHAMRAGVK